MKRTEDMKAAFDWYDAVQNEDGSITIPAELIDAHGRVDWAAVRIWCGQRVQEFRACLDEAQDDLDNADESPRMAMMALSDYVEVYLQVVEVLENSGLQIVRPRPKAAH
jgi:hypothetical protein